MIFGNDRHELRQMYVDAWRKHCAGELLTPLEAQIAAVVADHPEYQALIASGAIEDTIVPAEGETNPFLHMGLHLAVREQVATDRPPGIAAVFGKLLAATGDRLSAEHRAIDCLAEALWAAQASNSAPDERAYLERLRRLAG